MNVSEISELYSSDATANVVLSDLSKSQSYLLMGGQGLKVGEIVTIKAQPIVLDTFDLGKDLGKSKPTLCIIGKITDKNGKTRDQKMSLAQLTRRTYGTELKQFTATDYPFHETSDISFTTKVDKENETAELVDEIKFKVAKIETHYVSIFNTTTEKSVVDENGFLVLKAKQQPIFKTIK
jgi:hypothetical protein